MDSAFIPKFTSENSQGVPPTSHSDPTTPPILNKPDFKPAPIFSSERLKKAFQNSFFDRLYHHTFGVLDNSRSIPKKITRVAITLLVKAIRKTGKGLVRVSSLDPEISSPYLNSLIPFVVGLAFMKYGVNQLRDGYHLKHKKPGELDRKWVAILRSLTEKEKLNTAVTAINVVKKPNNHFGIGGITVEGQDNPVTRVTIPLSQNDLGFYTKEIGRTATCTMKGVPSIIIGLASLIGASGRVFGKDLYNKGYSGMLMHIIAATPNVILTKTGELMADTNSTFARGLVAALLCGGGFYSWSTIKLTGPEHGWFDWQKEGWGRVAFKNVAKDVARFVLGCGLLLTAAGEAHEIIPNEPPSFPSLDDLTGLFTDLMGN